MFLGGVFSSTETKILGGVFSSTETKILSGVLSSTETKMFWRASCGCMVLIIHLYKN